MQIKYGIAKIENNEMKYFFFGEGEKSFVILPGLSLKSVIDSAGVVANAFSKFTKDFTVYVFDRPQSLSIGCTIQSLAKETASAMTAVGIKNACVFGASQGGMIAEEIAINYPELVDKLVLGSTCARENATLKRVINKWAKLALHYNVEKLNHDMYKRIYTNKFYKENKRAFSVLEKSGTKAECDRFYILAKACNGFNAYDRLNKIKCPTFVLGAVKDKVLTGRASVKIAQKLNAKIYMYNGFAHAVYDEASDYRDKVLNFLVGE